MYETLTEHQKNIIANARLGYNTPTKAELEELNNMNCVELWQEFLSEENDPEEVMALHTKLFRPYVDQISEELWRILCQINPVGFNTPYVSILAVSGRQDQLLTHLQGIRPPDMLECVREDSKSGNAVEACEAISDLITTNGHQNNRTLAAISKVVHRTREPQTVLAYIKEVLNGLPEKE